MNKSLLETLTKEEVHGFKLSNALARLVIEEASDLSSQTFFSMIMLMIHDYCTEHNMDSVSQCYIMAQIFMEGKRHEARNN